MPRPFRLEINVTTGKRQQIELTDEEIARAEAQTTLETAAATVRDAELARKAARQARLDALLDKMEADPTILDRIR